MYAHTYYVFIDLFMHMYVCTCNIHLKHKLLDMLIRKIMRTRVSGCWRYHDNTKTRFAKNWITIYRLLSLMHVLH